VAEIITKPDGDALSKLVQLQAGRHDIRLVWTGNGVADLIALCNAHAIQARMSRHLWTGMRELMMMPEMKELPEPLQAQMMSIVLKAQALVDLDTEGHLQRMARADKPKGTI
jgi:hypothetical protein